MRVIVTCAGHQRKWGGYLGVPSHLAPLADGTPLLHRTLAQAARISEDVHYTTPSRPGYEPPAGLQDRVTRHVRDEDHPSEYASTRDLWSTTGRTVLMLGDCYFTDAAAAVIGATDRRDYIVFGRKGPSKVTNTPWGEIFAVSWWPEHHELLDRHLAAIAEVPRTGATKRPDGWLLLRSIQGTPLGLHRVVPRHFHEIDDATDDFDFPEDYDRHPATPTPAAR
ncbi:hypothetical protein [Actinomadura sp. K4S16]|uniref:hypothetical protein n=1 Tax=Actinomadura sp. K4S16 TaxID=1316147 RepID=UPI0011F067AB|nr:hypothetical protein [Actinomadura sp. K4S16]